VLHEEYWAESYLTGEKGQPAYNFLLDLQNLPPEATERVRAAAEELLMKQGGHRTLVRNACRAIAQLCTVRLAYAPGSAPATVYVVQVVWGPKDDRELVLADLARIRTWALRMSESDPNPDAQYVWGSIVEGLDRGPSGPLPG
jgi:hypothetical protein